MKRSVELQLLLLGSLPLVLASCESSKPVAIYTPEYNCEMVETDRRCCSDADAQAASEHPLVAPKYALKTECELEFAQCQALGQAAPGYFAPVPAGVLLDDSMRASSTQCRRGHPIYRVRDGKLYSASGVDLGHAPGAREVPASALDAPEPRKTYAGGGRGGFGVSARGFGGGG